jgi:hypothetical protein
MYNLFLTEEEISIILQALSYYQFNTPYITEETFKIGKNITNKIDEIL